jgi:putative flippase GtrA
VRKLILRLYGDERVRFVVVGGFNTVLGYGLFALFYLLFGKYIGYIACVYLQYAISIPLAFYLHRRITFRAHGAGRVMVDFLRFCVVYVISLAFNTVALPVLVEVVHLPPLLAQAIIVAVSTIFTYFGHKLFSFRRGLRHTSDDAAEASHESSETQAVQSD